MSGLTLNDVREQARPILMRLALVSHAPTMRMQATPRTRGTPDHRRPPGELRPPVDVYVERLSSCATVECALSVVSDARSELAHILRRAMAADAVETADELAARIIEDGEGWTAEDVSLAMRCTPTFVRNARLAVGRDPETGYHPPDADPMAVARELRAMGRGYRTIARLTGIPRSTLHDRLS